MRAKHCSRQKSGLGAGQLAAEARGKAPWVLLLGLAGALPLLGSKQQQKLRIRGTKKTHGGDRLLLTARFLSSLIRLKPK